MGNIPLPALSIRPEQQPGVADMYLKAMQIRSLLQGQQLSAAELTGKNLENQQRGLVIAGQQRAIAAQHDPAWDASDPDKAKQILDKYSVPLDAQNNVLDGIAKLKTLVANSSKETLALTQQTHNFFDDQFQAARNAPADKQQSTYEQAKQNAIQYANKLPSGVREAMLQQISNAPAAFDPDWLDTQHALLRTSQDLNEAALKKAQTSEATGKGAQADAEANLTTAKVPGATAESTIQQQNAAQGPTGRAMAGNLFYQAAGGNSQAGNALNLETQQKVAAAQAGVAGAPDALKGVAPHLVAPAAAAYDKTGQEYAKAYQAAQNMSDFIAAAKSGNKEAVKIVPLQGALEITTAQGVHRINRTEVDQFGGAGNLYDKLAGKIGGVITGKDITDSVLNDMDTLQKTVSRNAANLHANTVKTINDTYGSKFKPQDFSGANQAKPGGPPAGATMKVPGSDGKIHWSDGKKDLGIVE
jgi:hypothetical protein